MAEVVGGINNGSFTFSVIRENMDNIRMTFNDFDTSVTSIIDPADNREIAIQNAKWEVVGGEINTGDRFHMRYIAKFYMRYIANGGKFSPFHSSVLQFIFRVRVANGIGGRFNFDPIIGRLSGEIPTGEIDFANNKSDGILFSIR